MLFRIYKTILIISAILIAATNALASNEVKPRIYSASDVLGFTRIAQVQVSPDGTQVAYITFQLNPSAKIKKWQYSLFIKDEKGKTKLLAKADTINSINFSSDGKKIAFLAPGKKFQSIYMVEVHSARTKKLYEFTNDIELFKWSPDGKWFGFLAKPPKILKELTPIDVSTDYINTQLYTVSAKRLELKSLSNPNISVKDFDWSPDNKKIVFNFQPRDGQSYNNENKINILDLAANTLQLIPYTYDHTGISPFYSPDGKWIAFASNLSPRKVAQELNNDIVLNSQICVANTDSLATHCLAQTFNQNPSILGWDASSQNVLVLDTYKTVGNFIYALNLDANQSAELISNVEGFIEPLTVTLNNTHDWIGFGYETSIQAPEVFISSIKPFQLKQISKLNISQSKFSFGKTEVINWKSTDGMNIEGLLLTPKNYDPNKKYPLYVAVHGGPAGAWSQRYLGGSDEYAEWVDPTACWQNLLSLGFVVLAPNPRGSTGYGLDFRLANFADFGGGDYRDIIAGVDYLIQKGIADPNRLAIGGWSFGGYMTAWTISQTNRFKAAIDGDGNTNFISFSGTSDIPTYYERFLGVPYWINDKLYLERSPIMYTKNITTPLLIFHGKNDVRVPLEQSYELYTVLNRQHKVVKFLLFPDQGHVPTNPNIISESINTVDEWLQQALI